MSASATSIDMAPDDARLRRSRDHCAELSKAQAKNFYWGMKLVPEPKRSSMYALYAWMRRADDLADEAGDVEAKTAALERFQADTFRVMAAELDDPALLDADPLWPAFRAMARRHELPDEYLRDMIAGQLLDQAKTSYATFEELYDYCYKVASVVGLSCIRIWGHEGGDETRRLAEWRGIAFQLTNILRDVIEDARRGRVYLPAEDFGCFELKPIMFEMARHEDIVPGLQRVAERAKRYYDDSAPLDARVHPDGRACLWAMTRIYRGLLDKILADPAKVLSGERVRLSKPAKAWIALRAGWRKGR